MCTVLLSDVPQSGRRMKLQNKSKKQEALRVDTLPWERAGGTHPLPPNLVAGRSAGAGRGTGQAAGDSGGLGVHHPAGHCPQLVRPQRRGAPDPGTRPAARPEAPNASKHELDETTDLRFAPLLCAYTSLLESSS